MARLEVFRTPIGFHDAYVAAPSQKAALQAWGSDVDLFAHGVAEVVTDEQLVAEPLANPGKVIRRLRGTVDEQLAAAKIPDQPAPRARRDEDDAPVRPKRSAHARRAAPAAKPSPPPPPPPPPPPKPDRGALDAAEKALSDAQTRHDAEDRDWRERQAQLEKERRRLDRAHDDERERLAEGADRARQAYERDMRIWKAGA